LPLLGLHGRGPGRLRHDERGLVRAAVEAAHGVGTDARDDAAQEAAEEGEQGRLVDDSRFDVRAHHQHVTANCRRLTSGAGAEQQARRDRSVGPGKGPLTRAGARPPRGFRRAGGRVLVHLERKQLRLAVAVGGRGGRR
jgi:hypothetical protein